jgi:hypothetical protein
LVVSIRLERDPAAEDELIKPVVFLVTFVAVSALMVGLVNQYYAMAAFGGQADFSTGYQTIGGITYDMLDPALGYALSTEDAESIVDLDDGTVFVFEDLECQLVRDNDVYAPWTPALITHFKDFFWFKVSYGWFSIRVAALPFETILANYDGETNVSVNDLALGHRSYTFFVQGLSGGASTFAQSLDANLINISVGVNLEDALAHNSLWSTLGQILTLQLPDTHWIINLLMAVPIWTAIGVLAFLAIRSLVPW